MVTRGLRTKLWRDVWSHKGQFLAAAVVVACGIAVFVSLFSVYRNLRLSRDSYYRRFRFADFFIELERAPIQAVQRVNQIPGVLGARGRIVKDVPLELDGNEGSVVGRFISMPARRQPGVNDIHLVSGTYFSGADEREVIVNQRFCEANGLAPGDSFYATINQRRERLHIVGTAYSPEYVYPIRNPQQFAPNDRGFAIVFVKQSFAESAFDMGSAVNNIVGLLRPGADLEAVLAAAKRLLKPYGVYHRYGRDKQLSHQYVSEEIRQLRNSAVVVPSVFLLIAALVVHIIMSRITEQQRTQIGLLCALGYTKWQIVLHYLGYAFLVAGLGAVTGEAAGQFLAGLFMRMYRPFFRFPQFAARLYPDLFALSFAVSAAGCAAGTVHSVLRVARLDPAAAMRPPAPPTGRRILLERVAPLWSRLGVEWRTVLRNMARARARTAITVVGVATATVILLIGLTLTDFFDHLIAFQFNMVDRADLHVDFIAERPPAAVADVARLDGVMLCEGVLQYGFELRKGWREKSVLVMGLPRSCRLHGVYDEAGRRLTVPPVGVLLPERLARYLGVRPGSVLAAEPYVRGKEPVRMPVEAVAKQFVGLTVYADREYLSRLLGEGEMINGVLATVDSRKFYEVVERLDDMPGVSGAVSNRRILAGFRDTARAMSVVSTFVLGCFAGIIAFAVIYNSASINISERERELASLRAMGLDGSSVARVGTNDIMPLGLLGVAIGVPLGRLACAGMSRLYETDLYSLSVVIFPRTYATAVALIVAFLMFSRHVCKRKVARIDIIRVLKTRE